MKITRSRSYQTSEALESMVHRSLTSLDEPFPKHQKMVISTCIKFYFVLKQRD